MDKDKLLVFSIAALVMILLSMPSFAGSLNSKADTHVTRDLNEKGSASVIIKFSQPVSSGNNRLQSVSQARTEKYYEMNINSSDFTRLLANSSVETIYYNYPVKMISQEPVLSLVGANDTWSLQTNGANLTGKGTSICIIDTGVDYTHPDLGGCLGFGCKVLGGYNFIDNNSNIKDDNGHGTHVAGIAAANGVIKGVAPDVNIIAIKH